MSKQRITIKDVARLTGLSVASVSMALNDDPRVAEKTKRLVLEAAERLDYVPDSIGRALSSKRIGAIAVVIPHSSHSVFSHPYFNEILEGITEVANDHDLTVILSTSSSKQQEEDAYVKLLRTRRADGCIVASASIKDENIYRLASFGYKVVVLGRRENFPGVSVTIDDIGGAEQVVTHLIERHGLRRIAHISGPLGRGVGPADDWPP